VTEIDPVRALDAALEGFRVMALAEAAPIGDLFITVTANKNVIGRDHIEKLKGGAVLCNGGIEVDTSALTRMASKRESRESMDEYTMRDGRKICVITSVAAPSAAALDLHCATQALTAEYLLKNCESLEPRLHPVPQTIAAQVARLKLETMGAHLDRLTTEQEEYLAARDTVK
jgi:adenosylhomocysteinase